MIPLSAEGLFFKVCPLWDNVFAALGTAPTAKPDNNLA